MFSMFAPIRKAVLHIFELILNFIQIIRSFSRQITIQFPEDKLKTRMYASSNEMQI